MIFNLLKRLNDLEKVAVPFVWTKEDRDILIEVGAAQEDGQALGLKQLTLRGVGAPATLRRRIAHLIDSGYIEKIVHRNDRRAVVYVVSAPSPACWKAGSANICAPTTPGCSTFCAASRSPPERSSSHLNSWRLSDRSRRFPVESCAGERSCRRRPCRSPPSACRTPRRSIHPRRRSARRRRAFPSCRARRRRPCRS